MIRLTITTNIPDAIGVMKELPERFRSVATGIVKGWADASVKKAIETAPRFTGTLASNLIAMEITKQRWGIAITGPAANYGRYIEKGFAPHWIPIDYMEQHRGSPGQKGQWVDNPSGWMLSHPYGATNTGFIRRAIINASRELQRIGNNELKKEFAKKR